MEKSIYNLDSYINGNPEQLNTWAREAENIEDIWLIERILHKDLVAKYDEFITKVAELIRNLGFSSSIECSLIISHLIKNGFLSDEMSFNWENVDEDKELMCNIGTSIVSGEGCCRHLSSIQKDIFRKLGLFIKEFYCYYGDNTYNRGANEQANHVIGLIEHEGYQYGIDMGNDDRLYHFLTPTILRELAISNPEHLLYKPYYELRVGAPSSIEEIKRNLEKYRELSETIHLHPYDYEANFRQEAHRRLRRLEDTLRDFHEDTKILKKEITEGLQAAAKKKD